MVRKTLLLFYDDSFLFCFCLLTLVLLDVNLKCNLCSSSVDEQYALKGSSAFCMSCIGKPLSLINLFTAEGGAASAASPLARGSVQTQEVDATTQPDFMAVSKQIDTIGDKLAKITDKEISEGKGSQLLSDMKALMPKLQAISTKYPMVSEVSTADTSLNLGLLIFALVACMLIRKATRSCSATMDSPRRSLRELTRASKTLVMARCSSPPLGSSAINASRRSQVRLWRFLATRTIRTALGASTAARLWASPVSTSTTSLIANAVAKRPSFNLA